MSQKMFFVAASWIFVSFVFQSCARPSANYTPPNPYCDGAMAICVNLRDLRAICDVAMDICVHLRYLRFLRATGDGSAPLD
jgi:hypothetical protein